MISTPTDRMPVKRSMAIRSAGPSEPTGHLATGVLGLVVMIPSVLVWGGQDYRVIHPPCLICVPVA